CADNSSKPKVQSASTPSSVTTSQSLDTIPESAESPTPPAAVSVATDDAQSTPTGKTDTDSKKDPVQEMLAQIKDLQGKRPNANSREEFMAKMRESQNTILELSQKVLDAKP